MYHVHLAYRLRLKNSLGPWSAVEIEQGKGCCVNDVHLPERVRVGQHPLLPPAFTVYHSLV